MTPDAFRAVHIHHNFSDVTKCQNDKNYIHTFTEDNNVDNQLDATITVYQQFQSAQHVSGDGVAHPQEH